MEKAVGVWAGANGTGGKACTLPWDSFGSVFETGLNSYCMRASKKIPGNTWNSVAAPATTHRAKEARATLAKLMRSSIKNKQTKKKKAEKTPRVRGPCLSEALAALFSCLHWLPGDPARREAQGDASKQDTSLHKPEASPGFAALLLTAEECL